MNASYLESSEQLGRFFPTALHKIKLHIFQNICKYFFNGSIPIKYKNTCQLCDNILGKDKRGQIMVKKYVNIHEEVIGIFHENFTFPKQINCNFILLMSGFLVQWNLGTLEMIFP